MKRRRASLESTGLFARLLLPPLRQCGAVAFALGLWLIGSATVLAATHAVDLFDDEFIPKTLIIEPGDTVVWTNQTGSAHTVIADDGTFASTAAGGPFIPFNQTFTHTFTEVGRNPYYCQLHGGPGGQDMSGVVRVIAPGANAVPATPMAISPVAGATGLSVAPTLTASAFSDADAGDTHAVSQWIVRTVGSAAVLDTGEDAGHRTSLPLSGLAFATTYAWKVRYRDDRGAWSEYSSEATFTTVAGQPAGGTGLSASYGRFVAKTGLVTIVAARIDPTVSFDWKLGKPHPSVPANHFFVRWEGKVTPEFSERYRFRVRADGGVRLWINGQPIIDDWITGPFALFRNGVVEMEAGVPATLKLEYFDTLGAASVNLRWSSPSQPAAVIPPSRLFPLTP